MELNNNKEENVNANQIIASRPMVLQDSNGRNQKQKGLVGQTREANLRRTPPHLLNQQSREQINIGGSTFMSHQLDCFATNPMQTSRQIHNRFGFSSAFFGTPMIHNISSGHLRPLVGENNPSGSNPGAGGYQLNHQLSIYPVAPLPRSSQNNAVDFFGHQQRGYQCNQLPASNVQLPLPTYQSSQISSTNTSNAGSSQLQSILGKRPAESESFFPLDGNDEMAADARGPQCSLDTCDLVRLVQSVGTPEFLAISERVLASSSSLHEPTRAAASAAAPAHFPVMSSNAVPEPSSLLDIKDGNGDEEGKGEDVWSYWNCSAIARTLENWREMRTRETTIQKCQSLPVKTLGLDGHGQGSSKSTMQRCP
ncbi:hypothetical protein GUJ93_ZPchr0001g32771 [Zizania palustris]|uniref:Uncharacterized protein n=1 Tax=Zizania palustris TaxID=103762 RepID=A0A8J5S1M4_ZIZPA|nr:hypothetical protein GUJ93_ZPchr0001g32771 [Zizania palustris]